jgi:outer membrane protein TolC
VLALTRKKEGNMLNLTPYFGPDLTARGYTLALLCTSFALLTSAGLAAQTSETLEIEASLSLELVVNTAVANDPWLSGNQQQQRAMEAMSVAAGQLPDPQLSIGIANLATDTFAFNQEPMTQLKVGVSQMFPRGESRALKQKQLATMAQQYPYQRQSREINIAQTVALIWLDAYKARQSITIIQDSKGLFEQLVDVAEASYSSAVGKTRQQDIVRAQLELTRLEDRLSVLLQQKETAQLSLHEWLATTVNGEYQGYIFDQQGDKHVVSTELPNITLLHAQLLQDGQQNTPATLVTYFSHYPQLKAIAQKQQAAEIGIALEKQKYQPGWGINSSYAYRDDAPSGQGRADFFSIGLSLDVPLFTENRQDKLVESAIATSEAIKTEKLLLLRQLISSFETLKAQFTRLTQRQALYEDRLLPQMSEQAEASLTAYTHNDGDFAEVVRARIAQLNAQLDALVIKLDRQKTIIKLNALFATSSANLLNLHPMGEHQ